MIVLKEVCTNNYIVNITASDSPSFANDPEILSLFCGRTYVDVHHDRRFDEAVLVVIWGTTRSYSLKKIAFSRITIICFHSDRSVPYFRPHGDFR